MARSTKNSSNSRSGSNLVRQPSVLNDRFRQTLILALAFFCAAVGGVWYFEIPLTFEISNPTIIVPLVSMLIGVVALGASLFDLARVRKFGQPILEFAPAQGGGTLIGNVRLDRDFVPTGDFKIVMKCRGRIVFYDGERGKSDKLLWSVEDTKPWAGVMANKCVPISLKLPVIKTLKPGDYQTYWTLEVRAPVAGLNFYAQFSPVAK